jgi:hypothetical protein
VHTKEMRPSDAPVLTPWRYRPSTLVRVSALFYALLAFGFGVFVSVGSFLTSLCTGKCLAQGGGPVPAWVPLLGLLVFSVIAAACASVGWISVSCDGQTLHIVRSWWRRRDVDLADIRVVRSGRYGPRITLLSGAMSTTASTSLAPSRGPPVSSRLSRMTLLRHVPNGIYRTPRHSLKNSLPRSEEAGGEV